MTSLIPQLEALLFIYGEPLQIKKIVKIVNAEKSGAGEVSEETVRAALNELADRLNAEDRGLELILDSEQTQLTTKPSLSSLVQKIVKEELNEALTPAALETLAVIIYAAPVSRSIIDYIRGVNSTFILRALLLRGLVERDPDPHRPNSYLYRASFECLKHLGITSPVELPDYNRLKEIVNKLKAEN